MSARVAFEILFCLSTAAIGFAAFAIFALPPTVYLLLLWWHWVDHVRAR